MSFRIDITGLEATIAKMKKAGVDVANEVDAEIGSAALNIERNASAAVRKDRGFLLSAIKQGKVADLVWEVVAQKFYAPYVEFGTGGLVDIPQGLEDYAAQFKGKGIRKVNLPARPFMFPALMAERRPMIERIKKVLTRKR
jgi:HK97 gp10 family phage protein